MLKKVSDCAWSVAVKLALLGAAVLAGLTLTHRFGEVCQAQTIIAGPGVLVTQQVCTVAMLHKPE